MLHLFIVEKVWFWFGLDSQFGQTDEINGFWFALVEFGLVCLFDFGLVWFAYSTNKSNNYLFLFYLAFVERKERKKKQVQVCTGVAQH